MTSAVKAAHRLRQSETLPTRLLRPGGNSPHSPKFNGLNSTKHVGIRKDWLTEDDVSHSRVDGDTNDWRVPVTDSTRFNDPSLTERLRLERPIADLK
jgi:hypothetical protein